MKSNLYNILIEIFFIFSFFKCIFTKSILVAKNISKGKCDKVLGRYTFNINAQLNGDLTESMFENYIIKSNNINNLEIKCHFHEEKIPVENKEILLHCYINNTIDNQLRLNFEGSSNYLELINFNEEILYIDNISCPNIKLRNIQIDTTYSSDDYGDIESTDFEVTDELIDDMTSINEAEQNCTSCCDLNSNCDICDNSGNCLQCSKGYYITESNNRKCSKCLSTCEECETIDKCKECKDGYILSNGYCVSCFSIKEGCEECFQNTICYKCYDNNIFKYSLNNSV